MNWRGIPPTVPSDREIRAVEQARLAVANRLRATRGSVYEAFRNTACGLDPDMLEVWWKESPAAQSMGDQSGKAFGCALSLAMMAVESDRDLRRKPARRRRTGR